MTRSFPNLRSSRRFAIAALSMSFSLLPQFSTFPFLLLLVEANPKSRPYVAYRTDPFDQEIVKGSILLQDGVEVRGGRGGDTQNGSNGGPIKNRPNRQHQTQQHSNSNKDSNFINEEDDRCPLSFRLGSTHSSHFGSHPRSNPSSSSSSSSANHHPHHHAGGSTHTPPIIHPLHPDFDAGSGRQILMTTDYETLEMWTPSSALGSHVVDKPQKDSSTSFSDIGQSTEQMKEDEQFPLLFESSSFYHTSPLVHDVEGDGIADAILGDYDGNLHLVGLDFERASRRDSEGGGEERNQRRRRYYRRLAIPRLHVRKAWYEVAINRTLEEMDMAAMVLGEGKGDGGAGASDEKEDGETGKKDGEEGKDKLSKKKWEEFEPYHTYFAGPSDTAWRGDEEALRAFSGDVLNMDADLAKQLSERKAQRKAQQTNELGDRGDEGNAIDTRRRLEEVLNEPGSDADPDSNSVTSDAETGRVGDDYMYEEEPELFADDSVDAPQDGTEQTEEKTDSAPKGNWGDDYFPTGDREDAEGLGGGMDDYYYRERYAGYGDDMYRPEPPEGFDSYEEYEELQSRYYHEKNYLRLPPHLLSSPTLVELPRSYVGANADPIDRIDELLLCAVSYYFDEDEYGDSLTGVQSFRKQANTDGGDETEEKRGRYVANAIMGYNLRWKYWALQEVLDLSTDWSAPLGDIVKGGTAPNHSNAHSGMGAWALATPIAVKLDGGERNHVLVGTSMGLVYALEVQYRGVRDGWPVQMRHPVEQKVLVEDVVGNTNLEVFVVDSGGDLVSLNADGEVLWARRLLEEDEEKDASTDRIHVIRGTSPMSMGDVEGTGNLAIVLVAKIATTERSHVDRPDSHDLSEYRLFAIDAVTGDDLPNFPMIFNGGTTLSSATALPQPLLVDLHEDQSHWLDTIHGFSEEDLNTIRSINREAAKQRSSSSHGGNGRGLHIVQPLESTLHIIEGSTSCAQAIDVGDHIPSMVQADDVHGTGGLDLVVTTEKGEILTLESEVVQYHPLNVWNAGVTRTPGSNNAQAHGYSSTQGIFVHPIARQFRDILGIYVPITFEIFDRRPNIENEPNRRVYQVDIRAGMSAKRTIFSKTYASTGVYTERIQIPFGPGYYALSVRLRTTHGIVYEDTFHIGFNVNYMGGLWWIVCFPLIVATVPILMFRRKPNWEEDEDYGGRGTGILGRMPPP